MFARRAGWDLRPNALARAAAERRARGRPLLDLSDANPTRVGLAPAEPLTRALAAAAADPATARYEPDPRGPLAARTAVARYHARRGAAVDPAQVVLTAGTSEGYAHLFRLLADPGDRIHVPRPGYPLFDELASLEGVEASPYPLEPPRPGGGARWRIDRDALAAGLAPRSRAVLAIDPHNPTGSYVDPEDWASLRSVARERDLALVSDEVFADFAAGADAPAESSGEAPPRGALDGAGEGPLHFVLSGASKVLALPQLKVAWIVVAGPAAARDQALARLEFLADAYLSVSPIAAATLPALLAEQRAIQAPIRARVAANRAALATALAGGPAQLLPAEGGWAALVHAPGLEDDEGFAEALLAREGVLVQPGSLFDLAPGAGAALVVSLLPERPRFDAGVAALARALAEAAR